MKDVDKEKRLLVSFSGGETSAYMSAWIKENLEKDYDKVLYIFANTGQENEQTLEFVEKCDRKFGLNVVWVEAEVFHNQRKGTGFKIVDYKTASREGEPFEEVIKKYGIPNQAYPHCTRELKLAPITKYARSIGWVSGSYDTAIGIRVDEIDRMSYAALENKLIYPLVSQKPMTKPMINTFWVNQEFRLNLKGYEGNCKWCWKKTTRKHLTLINEHPDWYDFPEKMEALYGANGYNLDGNKRVFFRKNLSTKELRKMAKTEEFVPYSDDSIEFIDISEELDTSNGCSESCEVKFEEAINIEENK